MAQFDATLKGIAAYVHVDTPDKPKWDTRGKDYFTITVRAPKARVAEVCKQIIKQNQEAFGAKAKQAHRPFDVDEDGTVAIKAKSQYQPGVFDIRGEPMEFPTRLGSGSLVYVKVRFKTYSTSKTNYGTTGYLQGVQVLKLRKYQGGSASFGDASGLVDDDDEAMFEAFEEDDGEDQKAEDTSDELEPDEEDLSAADF